MSMARKRTRTEHKPALPKIFRGQAERRVRPSIYLQHNNPWPKPRHIHNAKENEIMIAIYPRERDDAGYRVRISRCDRGMMRQVIAFGTQIRDMELVLKRRWLERAGFRPCDCYGASTPYSNHLSRVYQHWGPRIRRPGSQQLRYRSSMHCPNFSPGYL